MNVEILASLLEEAADLRDVDENAPKHDSWNWYAAYVDARNQGSGRDEAANAARLYMDRGGAPLRGDVALSNAPSAWRTESILVATDGSRSSVEAIEFAVAWAAERNAALTFVHVVPFLDSVPGIDDDDVGDVTLHEPSERDHAVLDQAKAIAAQQGVAAVTELLGGRASEEIVRYATSHGTDVIVVGSRGHRAVTSALLGSVSLSVLRQSECGVVVVRGASSAHGTTKAATAQISS